VRGQSESWSAAEIGIVGTLHRALLDLVPGRSGPAAGD